MILISSVFFTMLLWIEINAFLVVNPKFVPEAQWSQNIAKQCGAEKLDSAYTSRSMEDNGDFVGALGAFYGILI